jgi:hypothetical protein
MTAREAAAIRLGRGAGADGAGGREGGAAGAAAAGAGGGAGLSFAAGDADMALPCCLREAAGRLSLSDRACQMLDEGEESQAAATSRSPTGR